MLLTFENIAITLALKQFPPPPLELTHFFEMIRKQLVWPLCKCVLLT